MHKEIEYIKEQGFTYLVGACGPENENGDRPCYHVSGYQNPPTDEDLKSLVTELKEDPELGMTDVEYFELVLFDESDIVE